MDSQIIAGPRLTAVYASGDLPVIATRECLQNAKDAIETSIRARQIKSGEGRFEVTWDHATRTITWDLTTFTSEGMSISDFIATHHPNDAHFWLVTQGADTNGHVGPMRFYFDNMYVKFADGSTITIGDFELLNISKIIQTPHIHRAVPASCAS